MDKSRIMVVEDERLVALAIENCLKNMGYEVPLTVGSGEEAVRRVVEVEPDLVLMDIRLKGAIDGIEAAGMIRNAFHVPVVYLTAYSEDKTLERAKATEPFGYITKPFEERTLQATVEMALYKASMDRKLWRTKEQLQTILRCIGEGVAVMSTKGIVEYLNPTAQALLLGAETLLPDTSLGQIFKIFDGESREPAVLPVDKVIMNGENAAVADLLLLTKEHGQMRVDCSLAPLRDESGSIRGLVLSFRDVTERMKFRDIVTRELRQALELQKSLLPRAGRELPGLRTGWFLHPSDLAAGDLFDAFSIDAAHAGLYMIDVAGHGIASAVNSLLLHRLLSVDAGGMPLLNADPLSPRQVAEKLSSRFISGPSVPFFCFLYATIDPAQGMVKLIRAGQPYPIVQRKDGTLAVVRSTVGHAVGASEGLQLAEHELGMGTGDRLFLYSDGLIECRNPEMARFSEERLCAMIEKTRGLSLADAVAAIDSEIVQWRSEVDFEDDVCLLAVELA